MGLYWGGGQEIGPFRQVCRFGKVTYTSCLTVRPQYEEASSC
jgi:hypothetical protein